MHMHMHMHMHMCMHMLCMHIHTHVGCWRRTSASSRRRTWWRRAATACRAPPSTRRRSRGRARRARAHQRGLGRLLAGGDALPVGELTQARNDGIDIRSSARARRGRRRPSPPTTASCSRWRGAVWGVAIEIERAIKKNARASRVRTAHSRL
jgi:hypothetical protein